MHVSSSCINLQMPAVAGVLTTVHDTYSLQGSIFLEADPSGS
jgi:hypothetical protein